MTNEELCLRYQSGDMDAANELIENNMAYIRSIALKYHNGYRNIRLDEDDYTQAGSLALLRAAERFDPEKGAQFLTYAGHAVRNAIIDAIRTEYPDADVVPLEERPWDDGSQSVSMNTIRVKQQLLSTYETDPEHIYMQKEWLEEIHGAVNNLPARGRTWVIIRFGFEDDEPRTLTDMTRMFHLSESRARKTEEEALNGVRTNLISA